MYSRIVHGTTCSGIDFLGGDAMERGLQQPSRAQHQALCDRPQELPVCQYPAGRPGQRGDLQPD